MLLRDGVTKGTAPTVQVLEIASNARRQPSDILPYLPEFAKLFAPLPCNLEELHLRTVLVPVSDIECITRTTIKVVAPLKNLGERRGKLFLLSQEHILKKRRSYRRGERPVPAAVQVLDLHGLGRARLEPD
jgi:antiviral helicase SKI2